MIPDKPGWWRLRTLWSDYRDGIESTYEREFIVEVEEYRGILSYWLPYLDYREPVAQCGAVWIGPAQFVTEAQWAELRRLRDEARTGMAQIVRDGMDAEFTYWHGAAETYETCARLLGRELPEWKPGKEAK